MDRRGKKGAVAVLVTMILVSMIGATTVITDAAFSKLKESCVDGAINISCRSVLSEYDQALKEDYRIFAYRGCSEEVEYKLEKYICGNLNGSFKPFNEDTPEVHVQNASYSLLNTQIFEDQIMEAAKIYMVLKNVGQERAEPAKAELTIENRALINTLPTNGQNFVFLNLDRFDCEKPFMDKLSKTYMINTYIFNTFKSRFYDYPERQSYFNYEVEYILTGKTSEKESLNEIKAIFATVRMTLNTAHILSDAQKLAEVAKYVASIPAGADPVEAAVIITAWAAAETENDIKLLLQGDNVAFVKTDIQWAVPLYKAVGSVISEEALQPLDETGQSYEDYLEGLLYIQDTRTKLMRIMDLIQINLRATYNGSFLIKEHFTGFVTDVVIDEKEYSYEHGY